MLLCGEIIQKTMLKKHGKIQNVKLGKIAAEKEIVLNENKELQNKINVLEQDKINTTNILIFCFLYFLILSVTSY